MKKTFISLFLLSLLTVFGSLSVKADPIVKSFAIPNNGWNTSTSSQEACAGNISNQNNIINSGDFYWSGVYYSAAQRDDDAWTGIAKNTKCCSRQEVTFSASSYTISVITKWKNEEKTVNLPIIIINGNNYYVTRVVENSESQSFSNNQWGYARDNSTWQSKEATLEYDVNLSSGGGNYTISLQTADDGNGGSGGDKDKYLFKTLTITQNAATYDVTATASNGSVSGTGSYAEGAEVTLTPSPAENYSFTGWSSASGISISGHENDNPLVFTMPGSAVSITANFAACTKHTVTLAANNDSYGSVDGGGLQCDGSVTVTATPNSGYRFVNWTQGGLQVSTNAEYTFTLAADISLTANFEVNPCATTRVIQCETCDNSYTPGSSIPSQLNPNNTWNGHGDFYGTGYASFETSTGEIYFPVYLPAATYTFTVICANGGNKKLNVYNSSGTKVVDGASLSNDWDDSWKTATTSSYALSAGKYYIGLYAPGNYAAFDQLTITANSDVFCPNTITMQKSGDESAADPTSSPASEAMAGTVVTITAGEASANHYFSGWTVSPENAVTFADQTNATTTFVMPASNVTITANYGAVVLSEFTYTISGSGTIDCATANGSDVPSGTVITLTAEPSTDYVFRGWTATAGTFGDDAALTTTFTMPAEAATVTATFAQVDNKIITGSEATVIEENGEATLTVTSVSDFDAFNHNVLKFAYSNMDGKYKGQQVAIDAGYSSASSAGATGFGFYYKTEKEDDHVAFCFEVSSGQQVKWELQATNNVWKYYYFAHPEAASWKHSGIYIYMNGDDGGNHTTYKNDGAFYMSEIAATSITSKPDIANYHYTNNRGGLMAVNDYGTLCLPMAGTISGATLYSVEGKETAGDISYLVLEDQGTNVVAGKPYITQSTDISYTVTMSGAHSAVQDGNGLEGTYELINLTPYDDTHHNYFLYANAFKKAGTGVTVGAYRAYLDWDAVSDAPAQAPSARRIRMVIEGTEVQTGMETVTAMPKTTKVLIDGQLFIIREGKRYTLTGARAQ